MVGTHLCHDILRSIIPRPHQGLNKCLEIESLMPTAKVRHIHITASAGVRVDAFDGDLTFARQKAHRERLILWKAEKQRSC